MAATRNGTPVRTGGIAFQPAQTPIMVPTAPTTRGTIPSVTLPTVASSVLNAPIVTIPIGSTAISMPSTTANIPLVSIGTIAITPTVRAVAVTSPINGIKPLTILSPIVALTGKANPVVAPPVIFRPKPTPIKLLTQKDMVEETLSLDSHTFVNGQPVLDITSLRGDIVSMIDFKPIYNSDVYQGLTRFGRYVDDLYQTSLVRDTLRKYLLLNRATTVPAFQSTLNSITLRVNKDIERSTEVIKTLDGFIQKVKEINNVLDFKTNMEGVYQIRTPYFGLRDFVTQRMKFSEQSYNVFSDTKVIYQLLFDLSGILEKCSFNLLSNFNDADRSAYVGTPTTSRQQKVQDSITLDLTYGDNLAYTPDAIRSKYITDYVTFNSILNVLPASSTDRFKFLVNLLSKEFRVSYGLGAADIGPEASFFGFRKQGNPFDNVIGGLPSDIFIAPRGNNSLSTLFYLKTSTQNAVVLPFESRQVAGDGETVFVPGTNYFSDGILNGDFSTYNSYREVFSERLAKARYVFNALLLQQPSLINGPVNLKPNKILRNVLTRYKASQDLVRGNNNDSTNLLSFILFSLANSKPNIKFEIYKLLLLVILFDTRKTVTPNTTQTDRFRDLLLSELGSQKIQGFAETLTESNIPQLLDNQIALVQQLIIQNITPLPPTTNKTGIALSKNQTTTIKQTQQRKQLGKQVASDTSNGRNPENNVAQVQIQQFSNLIYALRSTDNLFKNVLDICKQMFENVSTNETAYHLLEGSSATRYHGLTLSSFILLVFEMFCNLVNQFAKENITYNLIANDQTTKNAVTQYIQLSFIGNALGQLSTEIGNFLQGTTYSNDIITDYETKLGEEDRIVENILLFFEQINSRLSNVIVPTQQETTILREIGTNNPNSLSTARTAKSILANFINKKAVYNPNNNRALDFYLPAGKAISDRNWAATKRALYDHNFISDKKSKLITIGIPYGFVKSALGARLNKNEVNNGRLQEKTSDLINIKVYKLDKNNDGIIYKPQQFKFDLSLFSKGFDAYPINELSDKSYFILGRMFQFYDFDEDIPFNQVAAKTIEEFNVVDPYYSVSIQRRKLGLEVAANLFRSFILDMYLHMTTGLNTNEETFISYTEAETTQFTTELKKVELGTADLTKIKFMAPEYKELLTAFQSNPDDAKLMLTLCNDIPKSVFRQKDYDRIYNIWFDINRFPVDINTMNQTKDGKALLQRLGNTGQLYTSGNETYKTQENLVLDSYFVNVELVQ